MNNRILLVEDEADMALIISDTLRSQGYEVVTATNGLDGLDKFYAERFDLIVADVMMPVLDGFHMATRIRKISPHIPLLFLTAKGAVDDIEKGFGIGADDYLRKPFELRELIVRIRSLLRRRDVTFGCNDRILIGNFVFNITTQQLSIGNRRTELSNIEARVLEKLAAGAGCTVAASDLMTAVWGRDDIYNRNSLHNYIHKLRRMLKADPRISIINQRGFGYMLSIESDICQRPESPMPNTLL